MNSFLSLLVFKVRHEMARKSSRDGSNDLVLNLDDRLNDVTQQGLF